MWQINLIQQRHSHLSENHKQRKGEMQVICSSPIILFISTAFLLVLRESHIKFQGLCHNFALPE